MMAGPSVIRTRNASIATPTASPKAIGLMTPSPKGTKNANTEIMMRAAATTTLAEWAKPSSIQVVRFPCTHSSRMREERNIS